MNTIVIATDDSEPARAALDFAIQLAGETGASLCCVSVDDSLATLHADPAPAQRADAAARAAREHGLQADAVSRVGLAVEEILAVAEERAADLLVVGSRGHGAVSGALLGSVSLGLLGESRRPVAIVKATHAEATRGERD